LVEISRRRLAGQEREAENLSADILKYVEDLRRGLNADIGRKDFFEMASNILWIRAILRRKAYPDSRGISVRLKEC
jgi:hypothetical protein